MFLLPIDLNLDHLFRLNFGHFVLNTKLSLPAGGSDVVLNVIL